MPDSRMQRQVYRKLCFRTLKGAPLLQEGLGAVVELLNCFIEDIQYIYPIFYPWDVLVRIVSCYT